MPENYSPHAAILAYIDTFPEGTDGLQDLAAMYATSMRASARSPRTIKSYMESIKLLADFLKARGMPTDPSVLTREHVEEFLADLADRTAVRSGQPMTITTRLNRFRSLHAFFEWAVERGEIDRSPMDKLRAPKRDKAPPPVIGEATIDRLLSTCKGKDFYSRRDYALFVLLLDTGMRREEVSSLQLANINWADQTIIFTGKGRKTRGVGFGDQAALALRAYLRVRRSHLHRDLPDLWIGQGGALKAAGIWQILRRRTAEAGIDEHLHLHLFRHSWAHYFRVAGASEDELQTAGGWESTEMVRYYGSGEASHRAKKAGRDKSAADRLLNDKKP